MTSRTSGFNDDYESSEERAAAARAELYATHKARGSLGVYYQMFPDEAPSPRQKKEGQERER